MEKRKSYKPKTLLGHTRKIGVVLPEPIAIRFEKFIQENPEMNPSLVIRQATKEYLDNRFPETKSKKTA